MPGLLPVLAATVVLQMAAGMATMTVPVLGPKLTGDLGLPPEMVGLFSSLSAAGTMWFMLASGRVLPRFGPVRSLQLGMALCALALGGVTAGVGALVLVSAVLVGFGYGPNAPASSQILARLAPPRWTALVFSVKQAAVPLGGAVVGLLAPFVATRLGWQAAAGMVAALALAAAALVQPLRATLDADREPRRALALRDLVAVSNLRSPLQSMRLGPALPRLTAAGVAFAVLQGSTFSFMVTYLVERVGFGLELAGVAFAAMQALGMASRVVAGSVAGPLLPPRRVLTLLAFAGAATTLVIASFDAGWPAWLVVAACGLDGCAVASWNGIQLAEVARAVPPERVGDATAGSTFFVFIGYVLGPAAFSGLVVLTDSYVVAFTAAGLTALAAGAGLAAPDRRGGAAPEPAAVRPGPSGGRGDRGS